MRTIAIDWSGRKAGERQVIRVAEARDGKLVRIEGGRSRTEVIDHLISEKLRDPNLVAGFDFSFSLPAWFVLEQGCKSAPDLWRSAEERGEDWLASCDDPFWGRAGRKRPPHDEQRPQLRRTDVQTAAAAQPRGLTPRSPFQISGAGSVGASTVRGLPCLARLRDAGFNIWPWNDVAPPAAIEIWTRIAIGDTVKSSASARLEAVAADRRIPKALKDAVAESEDSFDAATTAVWLSAHTDALLATRRSNSRIDRLEGKTWLPSAGAAT